jgi:hypothetical protein
MSLSYSPAGVFISAFAASTLAGVAAFLRSDKPINWKSITTAGLNSGLLGLAISLLWYKKFQGDIYFLVGICVLTGLTGAAGLDFVLTAFQRGGFHINFDNSSSGGGHGDSNIGFKVESEANKNEHTNAGQDSGHK